MVNEAAILAARSNNRVIGQNDFEEAIERVIAGPERKSRLIDDDEKLILAYHEAGHAVAITAMPESDPVHKISIISRGMAEAYVLALPEQDRRLTSRRKMFADLVGTLGGRAAEEIVFNDITSGASNDIERVTALARRMVTRWGMSEVLGPMVYGKKDELIFLGREISEQRDYGDKIADLIDEEVNRIISEACETARRILAENRARLIQIAQKLVVQETLEGEELERLQLLEFLQKNLVLLKMIFMKWTRRLIEE